MITVYIDVLFIVNLYINYFLLLMVSHILGFRVKKRRMLLSAVLSAGLSVAVFFIPMNFLISTLVRVVMAAFMCAVAFSMKNGRRILKSTILLFGISFFIAGVTALYIFEFKPDFIMISNSVFYIDISLVALCIITLLSYLVVEVIDRLLQMRMNKNLMIPAELCLLGRVERLTMLCDTGNNLTDAFSGRPVAVVSLDRIKRLLPEDSLPFFLSGGEQPPEGVISERCRVVPAYSIGGAGLLPAFICDCLVLSQKEGRQKHDKITIAVTKEAIFSADADGLVGPKMLEKE